MPREKLTLKSFGFLPGFPEVDGNRMEKSEEKVTEKVRRHHTVVISGTIRTQKSPRAARAAYKSDVILTSLVEVFELFSRRSNVINHVMADGCMLHASLIFISCSVVVVQFQLYLDKKKERKR